MTVDAQRVGRREDLLARHVRVVADAADRLEVGREPDGRRHEADRHVRPRAVEAHASNRRSVSRVATSRSVPPRSRHAASGSSSSSRQTWAIASQRRSYASLPRRCPGRRDAAHPGVGAGAMLQFVVARLTTSPTFGRYGQDVLARPRRVDAVERLRRRVAAQRDPRRTLVREPLEPVDHPGRHELEGRLVGVGEPLALDPRVVREDVDPARAALVRRTRDLARELLLAGVVVMPTIWPGWTFAPKPTMRSANLRVRSAMSRTTRERTRQNARVRLNAYLARAGIASRRGADELIKAGRVTVNGARGSSTRSWRTATTSASTAVSSASRRSATSSSTSRAARSRPPATPRGDRPSSTSSAARSASCPSGGSTGTRRASSS